MKPISFPGWKQPFPRMDDKFRFVSGKEDVRIDVYLTELLSLPRSRIKSLIEDGHVRVDDKPTKPSLKLKLNMIIEGELLKEEVSTLVAEDIPVPILYEDDYLLVIDKPKDMVVHPSLGHQQGTLVNAILSHIQQEEHSENHRPGVVHRLDKGTTGVIIIAKDVRTQENLSRQFHERTVEKVYRAVVEGTVRDLEGVIEGNLGRHPVDRKRMALVDRGGRTSLSRYKVLTRLKGFTFVEVHPKTGRTHQIRVHLKHIGHPIVGDDLYGKLAKRLADRPLLHALRISFDHPHTGARITVEAPMPADIDTFVRDHLEPKGGGRS
jgi:23S rRNA pseudouridine1911/1915/1917 synthase